MKGQNLALVVAVLLLAFLPLWLVQAPECGSDGKAAGLFGGADAKGQAMIGELAPDYRRWFEPLFEPASEEVASLLFALQAALGAGVIGYWLGASATRHKLHADAARAESPLVRPPDPRRPAAKDGHAD